MAPIHNCPLWYAAYKNQYWLANCTFKLLWYLVIYQHKAVRTSRISVPGNVLPCNLSIHQNMIIVLRFSSNLSPCWYTSMDNAMAFRSLLFLCTKDLRSTGIKSNNAFCSIFIPFKWGMNPPIYFLTEQCPHKGRTTF